MGPDDLDLMFAAGRPALSPDGSVSVVAVDRPDFEADGYVGGLWVVPTGSTSDPADGRRRGG